MVLVLLESKRERDIRTIYSKRRKVRGNSLLKPLWQVKNDLDEKRELLVLFTKKVPTIDTLGLTIENLILASSQEIEKFPLPSTPGTSNNEILRIQHQENIVYQYLWDDDIKRWSPFMVNFFSPILKNRFHNIESIIYDVLIEEKKVSELTELPPRRGITVLIMPEML